MKGNVYTPFLLSRGFMPSGFYGSPTAGRFVSDAISGADSLDIITIGDSNAGYSYGGFGGGGGGWTRGLLRGLNAAGAPTYGSPLMPIMSSTTTTTTGVVKEDDGTTITTLAGYFSNVIAPTGTLLRGSVSGPAEVTRIAVPATTFIPYGVTQFNYGWVAASTTFQTFSQLNATYPGGAEPSPALPSWNQPGTNLIYRVTHARTSTSGGSINPTIYKVTSGTYTALATTSSSTYNASGTNIQNKDLAFTMPSTSPGSALVFGWSYIGIATGPAGVLFDSVYKAAKGVSVHNLHYGSGQTSTTIANVVYGSTGTDGTFLENYFTQIVSRQVAAGGSGRVAVWFNAGINGGGDSGSTWTTNAGTIIAKMQQAWSNAGYAAQNLVFVCSVTHPLDTDYGGSTESNLAGSRTAANLWAKTYSNTTVVDLSQLYTAAQMTSAGYYSGTTTNEAHLSQAGYYAFGQSIINNLARCR